MAVCVKCGKPCTGIQHVECPKPNMKPMSRDEHDEILSEQEIMAAACNRLLTENVPVDVFTEAWRAVLSGKLSRADLSAWLYGIGIEKGHGSISGVEYKAFRNKIDETVRKTDTKLHMTALSMNDKKAKKGLNLAQLKAREARA